MLCGFFLLAQPSQLDLSQVLLSHSFAIFIYLLFPYLFHKPVNCTFQFLDGVLVSMLYRIHNTVFNVIL